MNNVKKVVISWQDTDGNDFEETFEVGDARECGEYLYSLWKIKRIKEPK